MSEICIKNFKNRERKWNGKMGLTEVYKRKEGKEGKARKERRKQR